MSENFILRNTDLFLRNMTCIFSLVDTQTTASSFSSLCRTVSCHPTHQPARGWLFLPAHICSPSSLVIFTGYFETPFSCSVLTTLYTVQWNYILCGDLGPKGSSV